MSHSFDNPSPPTVRGLQWCAQKELSIERGLGVLPHSHSIELYELSSIVSSNMSSLLAVLADWLQPDDAERDNARNEQRAQSSCFLGEHHSLQKRNFIVLNDLNGMHGLRELRHLIRCSASNLSRALNPSCNLALWPFENSEHIVIRHKIHHKT